MVVRPLLASISALALLTCAAGACGHDTDASSSLDAGNGADGAMVVLGPAIIVTTLAPALTNAPAAKASATLAAYRLDEGPWQPLAPSAEGTYRIPFAVKHWAVALVCASDDGALSTVFVHRRTSATTTLDATLEDFCTPPEPAAEFALDGNLLHVPATTGWLDFGYARDSRGDALPMAGTTVPYEVVGIAPGTWDFTFGVRDDSFGNLTHVVILRGKTVTGDQKLDVDFTGAFTPGTRPMVLRGIAQGDSVTPQVLYGVGGPFGIEVGPQDVPANQSDVTIAYATIPESVQIASDRYHGMLSAVQDRRDGSRDIAFDFHRAVDVDLTFLPDVPAPAVKMISSGSQPVLLETRFPVLANAVRHEVRALVSLNRRTQHAWQATFDAASVTGATEVVDTMPDLSVLPGWNSQWALGAGQEISVAATGFEAPKGLGDGMAQRSVTKVTTLSP